jgi:type I restriction enzyme S subunit
MMVYPQFRLIDSLSRLNRIPRRTRDLLLPKLISGEVDVAELEIAVPEEENDA